MLEVNKQIVSALNTILPTRYELFCDSTTELPVITYREADNSDRETAESFGYSQISFYIKVWDREVGRMESYAISVDSKMRELGFTRISSQELSVEDQVCKVLLYRANALENYN